MRSSVAWSDEEPAPPATLPAARRPAGYEMRWWAPNGDDVVADVLVFASDAQARRYLLLASSAHCREQASHGLAAHPPLARNLSWLNPDGALQADVFFARGSRVYRVADAPAGGSPQAVRARGGLRSCLGDDRRARVPSALRALRSRAAKGTTSVTRRTLIGLAVLCSVPRRGLREVGPRDDDHGPGAGRRPSRKRRRAHRPDTADGQHGSDAGAARGTTPPGSTRTPGTGNRHRAPSPGATTPPARTPKVPASPPVAVPLALTPARAAAFAHAVELTTADVPGAHETARSATPPSREREAAQCGGRAAPTIGTGRSPELERGHGLERETISSSVEVLRDAHSVEVSLSASQTARRDQAATNASSPRASSRKPIPNIKLLGVQRRAAPGLGRGRGSRRRDPDPRARGRAGRRVPS